MKRPSEPNAPPPIPGRGPRSDWGKWRATRDKAISSPRRLRTRKDKKQ